VGQGLDAREPGRAVDLERDAELVAAERGDALEAAEVVEQRDALHAEAVVDRAADVLEALNGAQLRVLADVDGRGAGDALEGVERRELRVVRCARYVEVAGGGGGRAGVFGL
jgi:hypothetical protein